jgi:hypothetical protein
MTRAHLGTFFDASWSYNSIPFNTNITAPRKILYVRVFGKGAMMYIYKQEQQS